MSCQYIPSSHGQAFSQNHSSSTGSHYVRSSDDWIAQQSLFMGSHMPYFNRQVSLPSQDTISLPIGSSVTPTFPRSADWVTLSLFRLCYVPIACLLLLWQSWLSLQFIPVS